MATEDTLGFMAPGRRAVADPMTIGPDKAEGLGFSPGSTVTIFDEERQRGFSDKLAVQDARRLEEERAAQQQESSQTEGPGGFQKLLKTYALIKAAKSGNIGAVEQYFTEDKKRQNAEKEKLVLANQLGWKFATDALKQSQELPLEERGDFILQKLNEFKEQYGEDAASNFMNNLGNRAAAAEFQKNSFTDIMANDPKSPAGQMLRAAMRDPDPLAFEKTVNSQPLMDLMTDRYVKREGGRIIKNVQYQVKAINKIAKDKNHPMHERAKDIAENGISLMEMFTVQDELMDADGKAVIPENMRINEPDFAAALSSPAIQYQGNLTSSSEGFAEEMYKLDAQKQKEIEAAYAKAGIALDVERQKVAEGLKPGPKKRAFDELQSDIKIRKANGEPITESEQSILDAGDELAESKRKQNEILIQILENKEPLTSGQKAFLAEMERLDPKRQILGLALEDSIKQLRGEDQRKAFKDLPREDQQAAIQQVTQDLLARGEEPTDEKVKEALFLMGFDFPEEE